MSRPVRLCDDASASNEVRELLRSAGRSRPMTDAVRARSAVRVDRLAAVPVAAGLVLWIKGAAIAAGLGVAGVVVVMRVVPASRGDGAKITAPVAAYTRGATARRSVDIPAPTPVAPVPTPALKATANPPPSMTPPANASATASPATSSEIDPLAREAALLEKARSTLESDPALSLATLETHAAEFPSGTLRLERELLAVDALRRLGRFTDARTRGEALLARAPGSIYVERVRAILATLPPASP
jgi:hypothetical protein